MDLKTLVQTPAWKELKEYFIDELTLKPLKIKTEGKTNEQIALEVSARNEAADIVKRTLNKVERIAGKTEAKAQTINDFI